MSREGREGGEGTLAAMTWNKSSSIRKTINVLDNLLRQAQLEFCET
jgi:hypothetical protein